MFVCSVPTRWARPGCTGVRPSRSCRCDSPNDVAHELVQRGVQTSSGHYYAARVLDGLGVDPDRGVVRLSFVHYTSPTDVDRAIAALGEVLD